jgi:processing peptidase subunit beta
MSGSRFDSAETSGTSALLHQMLVRSEEFRSGVAKLGAKVHIHADREIQGVTLAIFNDQAQEAVSLLNKVFSRDHKLSETGLEAEKEVLHRRGLELQRDQLEQTFSSLYETSFEDHTMGLPLLGFRDNVSNLTLQDLEKHRDNTFLGSRMALVISGNVSNADATLQKAQDLMSSIPSEQTLSNNNLNSVSLEKPYLTSTVMAVRDDEMANLNVSVGYYTEGYGSENHFFYQLMQELVGDYNANDNGSAHVNSSDRQYNSSHSLLGELPGIDLMSIRYSPFSDAGLFTGYLHGNEIWAESMIYMMQTFISKYTKDVNQVEVYRARARIFNNLLANSRVSVVNNLSIGRDLLYVGRRIGRNETARRISAISESEHVCKRAKLLFYDKDISMATYGPQHTIDSINYYDRHMRKSTLHSAILANQLYS